jgi:hypothetical protein
LLPPAIPNGKELDMKRDNLFEKLEIILVIETLILLLAMINQPSASARQQPEGGVKAPISLHQPMSRMC